MSQLNSTHKWGNASRLAQKTIENRVEAHNQYLTSICGENSAMAPETLLDVSEVVECDPSKILESCVWKSYTMPYVVFYSFLRLSLQQASWNIFRYASDQLFADSKIDEWILRNEKWLRTHVHGDWPWQYGLVRLTDAPVSLPESFLGDSARTITRLDDLPGFTFLEEAREHYLHIQPSTHAFKRVFEALSDGLLKNLDWTNVFVAGGIVLGTLLAIDWDVRGPSSQWHSSDIDIYLYGLSPDEANTKINHIFDIFRSNLPSHMRTLVIRNSKTITFYPEYPLRRVQIVLKLVKNPKDVLLNFDLDICAMGWDGEEVWMLPRATRALETGFNTFTMNLIRGHYLSERRASQPQRIFKYANKGYGLRILPTYISSLSTSAQITDNILPLNISFLAEQARAWTKRQYVSVTEFGSGFFPRSQFHVPGARSSSILSSFTSLMRQVAFWEMNWQDREQLSIEDAEGTSTSYEDTYDSIPRLQYKWDESFNHARFRSHITQSNLEDIDEWVRADNNGRLRHLGVTSGDELYSAQRMTYSSNSKTLLERTNDIRMPIILPSDFAAYANQLVKEIQVSAGLREAKILEPAVESFGVFAEAGRKLNGEELFIWSISSQLMWQQVDRRIDELFEVLYAFRRANQSINEDLQLERFIAELSRRDVAATEDEFGVFAKWTGQHP